MAASRAAAGRPVVGVLLGAGSGSRFGGEKLLAPLPDGTPMGLTAARQLATVVDRTLCVVRPDDLPLKQVFSEAGFETVDCAEADRGMSASLMAGIRACPVPADYLIALADMPLIRAATIRQIFDALRAHGGIVVPRFNGRRGHPVGFAADYREALLGLGGDRGASPLLQAHADAVTGLDVEDPGVVQDIDTPGALERHAQAYNEITRRRAVPDP